MTAQFQPGDRVLVECIAGEPIEDGRTIIKFGDGLMSYRTIVAASSVHPLPTAPAQLRAAAEIIGPSWTASALLRHAARLESTSAPKPPPTLREAAEKALRFVERTGYGDHSDLDALREALAREGAAK